MEASEGPRARKLMQLPPPPAGSDFHRVAIWWRRRSPHSSLTGVSVRPRRVPNFFFFFFVFAPVLRRTPFFRGRRRSGMLTAETLFFNLERRQEAS